ncbi:translation initiation factor IF-2 [Equus quagga]|uniref:translation initiation factor IF-2 n=1 Tax=Equus quagga TaxID=89248 RepID=UPI001EE2CC36|nr:translation initiation factor IF-2 [Equus quagga]
MRSSGGAAAPRARADASRNPQRGPAPAARAGPQRRRAASALCAPPRRLQRRRRAGRAAPSPENNNLPPRSLPRLFPRYISRLGGASHREAPARWPRRRVTGRASQWPRPACLPAGRGGAGGARVLAAAPLAAALVFFSAWRANCVRNSGRRAPSALAGRPLEPRPRPRAGGQRGRRPERARRRLWAALPARREFKGLRPEACLPREVPADAGGAAAQLSHSLCPGSARARRLHRAGGFSPGRRLPASLSRLCKAGSLGSGLRRPCAARAPRGQERGRAPALARGHPRRPHRRGAPGPPGAVVPRCASPSPGDPSPHRRGGCWTAREPQPDSRPPRARGARKHGRRRTRRGGAAAALAAATDVAVSVLFLVVLPRPGLTRGGPSISSS